MPERLRSLRARLLLALLVPLALLLGAGAVLDYRAIDAMAQASHDRALAGLAIGLAARLETDRDSDMPTHLVAMMRTMNRFNPEDSLYYLVLDEQGSVIAGDAALAPLAAASRPQNPALGNAQVHAQPVRTAVYAYAGPDGQATIVVAETLRRQAAEVRRALVGSLVTNAATAIAVALAALVAIGVALAPLHALGERLEDHEAHDLRALRLRHVPAEVLPLVRALNRLMRRLRRAVQARQAFIHNTAHQLRTPLAGLTAQAQLLQQEALPPAAAARAGEVAAATQRLSRLVQQLLSLARTGDDAQRLALPERVALTDVLQEAASACLDDALARGIDLGFEPAPAEVQGSAWMLRELLVNLVGNAIVHTPAGTSVTVSCGPRPGGGAFLEVADDGPGIAEADRGRVFDRFVRLTAREGTGLGLAIVREIAEHHGAGVHLQDGPGGRGLAVRVEFPALHVPLPGSSAN